MRKTASIVMIFFLVCSVLLIAGCTDHNQLKQELLQAVEKQDQIQSYRFHGNAQLTLDSTLFQGVQPLTAAFLTLLKDSNIEYNGAVSLAEPVQMEAKVKLTPTGGSSSLEIPILIKDNKMYLQIPAVNKPEEYFVFPMEKNGEQLKKTGRLSAALQGKLLDGIKPDWLEPGKKDEKLTGGEIARQITLQVNDKNQNDFSQYFAQIVPVLLNELMTNGLSSSSQTDAWKTAGERFKVTSPSQLSLLIDGQGFIREQRGQLQFTLDGKGEGKNSIKWTYVMDDINQAPSFTMETPKQIKNFADILMQMPRTPNK